MSSRSGGVACCDDTWRRGRRLRFRGRRAGSREWAVGSSWSGGVACCDDTLRLGRRLRRRARLRPPCRLRMRTCQVVRDDGQRPPLARTRLEDCRCRLSQRVRGRCVLLHELPQRPHRERPVLREHQVHVHLRHPHHRIDHVPHLRKLQPRMQRQHRHLALACDVEQVDPALVEAGQEAVVGGGGEGHGVSGFGCRVLGVGRSEWVVVSGSFIAAASSPRVCTTHHSPLTTHSLHKGASRQVFAQESDARRPWKGRKSCGGKAQRFFPHAARFPESACHDLRAAPLRSRGKPTRSRGWVPGVDDPMHPRASATTQASPAPPSVVAARDASAPAAHYCLLPTPYSLLSERNDASVARGAGWGRIA